MPRGLFVIIPQCIVIENIVVDIVHFEIIHFINMYMKLLGCPIIAGSQARVFSKQHVRLYIFPNYIFQMRFFIITIVEMPEKSGARTKGTL